MNLPQALDSMVSDIPNHIYGWITAGVTSASALAGAGFADFFAQVAGIPHPSETNAWPFYGVLISAIIVLFLSIAVILRWVVTKMVTVLDANTQALHENSQSNKQLVEVVEKNIEYFEDLGKNAIRSALTTPPPPSQRP